MKVFPPELFYRNVSPMKYTINWSKFCSLKYHVASFVKLVFYGIFSEELLLYSTLARTDITKNHYTIILALDYFELEERLILHRM